MSDRDGAAPDPRARLRAAIAAFPGQAFVVVDGGHFDDLPMLLKRQRLFARSLFLDRGDRGVQTFGPWLVSLRQAPDATDKLLAVVDDKPAAVFWSCGAGEAVLYRHLRTINMARIPVWAADGGAAPIDAADADTYATALFRHFDPRVLGALMPCLDGAQFSRFLGPAEEVAFVSTDFGGLRRLLAGGGLPAAEPGMLTIRTDQILSLSARREAVHEARLMAYLREAAPQETRGMSEHDLRTIVQRHEASAHRVGLTHERSQAMWCFLMVASQERFEHLPKVRAYLRAPPGDPDQNLETLFRQIVRLADSDREVL